MPKAAFCGPPHSESEVYYAKVSAIGRQPSVSPFVNALVSTLRSEIHTEG